MDTAAPARAVGPDPMVPEPFRITRVCRELADTFTLELAPEEGPERFPFAPGQFNMLYVFGVGEVPISISGDPADDTRLVHTVRAVGPVTDALRELRTGDTVGVRGPFGTPWPVLDLAGEDLVIVGGGVGLAPLRPAIYTAFAHREKFGQLVILYGARTQDDILYRKELQTWRGKFDAHVDVTVDRATGRWNGNVGVVTKLIGRGGFDPVHAKALVCGPEVMMRFTLQTLQEQGLDADDVYISMERNMKCAVGWCGHCQWGGNFVCKDGPVFRYDRVADIFNVREV